jgi:AcrR family transcriptional regulator
LIVRPIGLIWGVMPRPRFESLPAERRREVLDAAAREFARHGYEGSSFNRVMAEVGASKGAFYYWFADKADLYRAVLAESVERMSAAMGSVEAARSRTAFWAQLVSLFDQVGRFYRDDPSAAVLALAVARGEGDAELVDRGRKWIDDLVAEGRRCGALRTDLPAELTASIIWSMIEAADHWLVRNRRHLGRDGTLGAAAVTASLAELVRRAFQAPPSRTSRARSPG